MAVFRRFQHILKVAFLTFVLCISSAFAIDCTAPLVANDLGTECVCDGVGYDYNGDGTIDPVDCHESLLEVKTIGITQTDINNGTNYVVFRLSAPVTLYVDWGDGVTEKISNSSTDLNAYSHTYQTASSDGYTIKFARAGNAVSSYNTDGLIPTIQFGYDSPSQTYYEYSTNNNGKKVYVDRWLPKIKEVSGSLGKLFPPSETSTGRYPSFYYTFGYCSNLDTIDPDLFSDISTGGSGMFKGMFSGCTGLTSIPENLFGNIANVANNLFQYTFGGCTGLTKLPNNLFPKVPNANASYMFGSAFSGCTNLGTDANITYIPATLFANMSSTPYGNYAMYYIFNNTALATTCPDGTKQYTTGFESYWDNKVACVPVDKIMCGVGEKLGQIDHDNDQSTPDVDACVPCTGSDVCTIMNLYQCPENYIGNVESNTCVPKRKYNITYSNVTFADETIGGMGDAPTEYYNHVLTPLPQPTREGYIFFGWYDNAQFTGDKLTSLVPGWSGDLNLYAKWAEGITIKTTSINANDYFAFRLSAAGTFYVDWGDDTPVETIVSGTTLKAYSHTYKTANSDGYTIKIISENVTAYNTDSYTPTIQFGYNNTSSGGYFNSTNNNGLQLYSGNWRTNIKEISGSLGKLLPWLGSSSSQYPKFYYTFGYCTNLDTIGDNLFTGISTGGSYMFYYTFSGCTSLTSIPENLFGNISGGARSMFNSTFSGCTGLTSIPGNLFNNISSAAHSMFYGTFYGCTGLTSIPENLFGNVSGVADYMFQGTFSGCTGLTKLPNNLFPKVPSANGNQVLENTFSGCTNLGTDANITYIPATLFANMSSTPYGNYAMDGIFNNTALATSCPSGTKQYVTGFENYWNGKVACIPSNAILCTVGEKLDQIDHDNDQSTPDVDACVSCSGESDCPAMANLYTCENPANSVGNTNASMCIQKQKYNITYNNVSFDGVEGMSSAPSEYWNDDATALPMPTRPGYMFVGWYENNGFTGDSLFSTPVAENARTLNLYAKWLEAIAVKTTGIDVSSTSNNYFAFQLSARGTFYVDWGDGSPVEPIVKNDTNLNTYSHTYETTKDYIIRIASENVTAYNTGTSKPAIRFGYDSAGNNKNETSTNNNSRVVYPSVWPKRVKEISGSLVKVFPVSGTANGAFPRFYYTFAYCSGLDKIDNNLFSGISTGGSYMFANTFYKCTGLTSIPENLFGDVSGAADYMFSGAFDSCTGLTKLPNNLFPKVRSANASYMFSSMFSSCTNLGTDANITYIPATLFRNMNSASYGNYAMSNIFYGTALATSCPSGTKQYVTGFEDYWNGKVACIPVDSIVCPAGQTGETDSCVACANADDCPVATLHKCSQNDYIGNIDSSSCIQTQTYNITYNNITFDGETIGGMTGAPTQYTNNVETVLPNPTRDGYMFMGWYKDNAFVASLISGLVGNVDLYARWVRVDETVAIKTIGITQTDINEDTNYFAFRLSSQGTFYIDWGDNSGLERIVKNDTNSKTYSHTYQTANSDGYTIRIVSENVTAYNGSSSTPAIQFGYSSATSSDCYASENNGGKRVCSSVWQKKIKEISGSLGTLFPVLGTAYNAFPRFYNTFGYCTNLDKIDDNLFSAISTGGDYMFYKTFYGCTGLTSLPENLFGNISGGSSYMFGYTFYGCTGLTSLPANLFSNISVASYQMFYYTFANCTGLTSLPENLFGNISGTASQMFYYTFRSCTGLTKLPNNLFPKIPSPNGSSSFYYMFYGCSNLGTDADIKYIPGTLFANMSATPYGSNAMSNIFNSTALATTCPTYTKQYTTGFESYWNSKVACIPAESELCKGGEKMNASTHVCEPCTAGVDGCPEYAKIWCYNGEYNAALGKCPPQPYTITYHNVEFSGETVVNENPATYNAWDSTIVLTAPVRSGYVFDKWCSIDATECPVANVVTQIATDGALNLDLYATWAQVHTITYHNVEYAGAVNTNPATFTKLDTITLTGGLARSGYMFDKWCSIDATECPAANIVTEIAYGTDQDVDLYATWTPAHTIRYHNVEFADETIGGMVNAPLGYTTDAVTTLPIPKRNGYRFAGWYDNAQFTGNKITSTEIGWSDDLDLYASWVVLDGIIVKTTALNADDYFAFQLSAQGTFYVDWGDGSPVEEIIKDNTSWNTCSHTYQTANSDGYTIIIASDNVTAYATSYSAPAIRFGYDYTSSYSITSTNNDGKKVYTDVWPKRIKEISGSFIKVFPILGTTSGTFPRFYYTFGYCSNLDNIGDNLFAGISAGRDHMFEYTFAYCTGLKSLPENLFGDISSTDYYTFYATFYGCTGLTKLPNNLFSKIPYPSGSSSFYGMFKNCTNLGTDANITYIPATLFANMSSTPYGTGAMLSLFESTALATTCPSGTKQYITGFEKYWDGKVACIPSNAIMCAAGEKLDQIDHDNDQSTPDVDACVSCSGEPDCPDMFELHTCEHPANSIVNIELNTCVPVGTHSITYNNISFDGETIGGMTDAPMQYTNTESTPLPKPTRDGYMFVGWYDNAQFTGEGVTSLEPGWFGNLNLYAKWADAVTVTTTGIDVNDPDNNYFVFQSAITGTLYVDWGDDSPVEVITANSTNYSYKTYSHTYTKAKDKYIVRIRPDTTSTISYGTSSYNPAIRFGWSESSKPSDTTYTTSANNSSRKVYPAVWRNKVKEVHGSFSRVFPVYGGTNYNNYPRFYYTFAHCENLDTIGDNLFDGMMLNYASNMFDYTFYGCTGLKYLPENLFGRISNNANQYVDYNFYHTFAGCTGLGTDSTIAEPIPANLFSRISGYTVNFYYTFADCTGLKSLPENLFGKFTNDYYPKFTNTFSGCTGLTKLPNNLFPKISVAYSQYNNFNNMFYGCTSLGTDAEISYIPATLFKNMSTTSSGNPAMSYMFNNTQLTTTCPTSPVNTKQYITGLEDYLNGKVACIPVNKIVCAWNEKLGQVDHDGNSSTPEVNGCVPCTGSDDCTMSHLYTCPENYVGNIESNACIPVGTYSITYHNVSFDGETISGMNGAPTQYTNNAETILPNPTRDGYRFGGWYTNAQFTGEGVTSLGAGWSGNLDLHAKWLSSITVTTTGITAGDSNNNYFAFWLGAKGKFYVDWGDGSPEEEIVQKDTNEKVYSHTYDTTKDYTITITPNVSAYAGNITTAIRFGHNTEYSGYCPESVNNNKRSVCSGYWRNKIKKISGSLGKAFPVLADGTFARFYYAFGYCENLEEIDGNLFSGISNAGTYMFYDTFYGCTGLKSLPENLFGSISGVAENMFNGTFARCTGLGTDPSIAEPIPGNLFGNISSAADSMFYGTFAYCTGLKSLPENLFGNFTGTSAHMFDGTFRGCTGLGTDSNIAEPIPGNLFGNISSVTGDYAFKDTFRDCTGLTSIPGDLFSKVSSVNKYAFPSMFQDCTGLTSIPENLFRNVSDVQVTMFNATFMGCTSLTKLPNNLFPKIPNANATYMFSSMFSGCTSLGTDANITYIPATLFANMSSTPYGSFAMSDIFASTALATTCPTGTKQYTTGFENYWNSKVACMPIDSVLCKAGQKMNMTTRECESCTAGVGVCPTSAKIWCYTGGEYDTETYSCTEASSHTITYNYNGGSILWEELRGTSPINYQNLHPEYMSGTLNDGVLLNRLSKDGYIFVGWCLDGESDTTCAANNESYAHFDVDTVSGDYVVDYGVKRTFNTAPRTDITLTARWVESKFEVDIDVSDTNEFGEKEFCFNLTAAGDFWVDWDAAGEPVSENAAQGDAYRHIVKSVTAGEANETHVCYTYYAGVDDMTRTHTIKFGGLASQYIDFDSANNEYAAIAFNTDSASMVTGISGSLGHIFPTLNNGVANTDNPRFYNTFSGCRNLTTLPNDGMLFDGVTKPASEMFFGTFYGTGITSIPANLFAGISGPVQVYMFAYTFVDCSNLTGEIPEDLFGRVVNGEYVGLTGSAPGAFMAMFAGTGITGIPANLFGRTIGNQYYGISGGANAEWMFASTFAATNISSIPNNLFAGIDYAAQLMFSGTFALNESLTTLTNSLFPNITSAPTSAEIVDGDGPFSNMFLECPNLTGYVPYTLFKNMDDTNYIDGTMVSIFAGTGLSTNAAQCPSGTTAYTGWDNTFRKDWSVDDANPAGDKAIPCVHVHTITYHNVEFSGETVVNNNPSTFTEADSTITLTDPTRDGYAFRGWCSVNANECPVANVVTSIASDTDQNVDLYATWVREYQCADGEYLKYDTTTEELSIETCEANYYCVAGTWTIYDIDPTTHTAGMNACVAGSTSAAGSSTCTCMPGYYPWDATNNTCEEIVCPEPPKYDNWSPYGQSYGNTINECVAAVSYDDEAFAFFKYNPDTQQYDAAYTPAYKVCDDDDLTQILTVWTNDGLIALLQYMSGEGDVLNLGGLFTPVESGQSAPEMPEVYDRCCPEGWVCCGAGTYIDFDAIGTADQCPTCPAGSYCEGKQWNPETEFDSGEEKCLGGTYSSVEGATSADVCLTCPTDYPLSADGTTDIAQCYANCPTNPVCVDNASESACAYVNPNQTTKTFGNTCGTNITGCNGGYTLADVATWSVTNWASHYRFASGCPFSRGACAPGDNNWCDETDGSGCVAVNGGEGLMVLADAPMPNNRYITSCNAYDNTTPVGERNFVPTVSGNQCWMKLTNFGDVEIATSGWVYIESYDSAEACANHCGIFNMASNPQIMMNLINSLSGINICVANTVNIVWDGIAEPDNLGVCTYGKDLPTPQTKPEQIGKLFLGWKPASVTNN